MKKTYLSPFVQVTRIETCAGMMTGSIVMHNEIQIDDPDEVLVKGETSEKGIWDSEW